MKLSLLAYGSGAACGYRTGNARGHWMSHDGQKMVSPNVFTGDSTQFDFATDRIDAILPVSSKFGHPLAVGMMPNASKYYVVNLLDSTMTVIDMKEHSVLKTINLIANYDPITGAISNQREPPDSNPSKAEGE
jgi:DNA-binding beta-propeller fold protein YncE